MKRIYHVLLLTFIAAITFKCQKELSGDRSIIPISPINQSSPITATLQGNVLDENGQPASGVRISAGSKITTTDAHGYFRISDAALDKNASLATAELPGYFKGYRSFRASTGVNQVVFKLIKKTSAGIVNATTGGEVKLANGAKVSLPANGIVKAAGGAYTGNVQVFTAYIDPTSREIGKMVPGSFMADDKDNNRVILSSYGMLAVELESTSGEKLQIATGSTAALTIPIPSSLVKKAPASISLWYVDEQTGIWKEQGTAKKSGDNYVGEVKHFSYWNCDLGLPAIAFSATFKTADGFPLKNVYVTVGESDTSSRGLAHGYTDSLGQAGGLIPSNLNLVLALRDECYNIVYTKNIGPYSQSTNLGTIVIPNTVSSLVTIKGKLLSCSNTPVSNGYAIVYWNNLVNYVKADAEGKFFTSILNCSGASPVVEILGVDGAATQQGSLLTISLTQHTTDAGNIIACGTSSAQFINYKLNGVDHELSNLSDSALYLSSIPAAGTIYNIAMGGYQSTENSIYLAFTCEARAGVYPVNTLFVTDHSRIGLIRPFNVTVTSFPLHPGGFYEGNFSGNFVDSTDVLITQKINGSFRLMKY
ncbi:MAG: carboxypeptidase-like regulatory domain-containing protein [Ferruginibacter sp.]